MGHLELVTIVVDDHDAAIDFFVRVLGFDLIDDSPSRTNDGRSKRWVVGRPLGAVTGLLLARADGAVQRLTPSRTAACSCSAMSRATAGRRREAHRVDLHQARPGAVDAGPSACARSRRLPVGRRAVMSHTRRDRQGDV